MRTLETSVARETARLGVKPGDGVLAAVSGGADSTALATLLGAGARRIGIRLVLAHVSHRMRPRQDPLDAAHVRRLAGKLGTPFHEIPLPRVPHGETDARQLRHEMLAQTARERGCAWIALGHTADDQAETVLWNLVRGTGLHGLAGMPARRRIAPPCHPEEREVSAPRGIYVCRHTTGNRGPSSLDRESMAPRDDTRIRLVRPLLPFRRDDLRGYLKRLRIRWREDATNRSMRFTRNRIRHKILPLLEGIRPGAGERIGRAAREARPARDLLSRLAREALPDPRVAVLPLPMLRKAPLAVRRSILRRWVRAHGGAASLPHLEALGSLALRGRTGQAVSYPRLGLVRRGRDGLRLHRSDLIPIRTTHAPGSTPKPPASNLPPPPWRGSKSGSRSPKRPQAPSGAVPRRHASCSTIWNTI
ncbi:MAG: tRNA lysidine(34) synthetase TilS [Planctomycetes bacterium]|nr:tRNA lysidine(34) synthetase TilS [Planctomycetota bacterium]